MTIETRIKERRHNLNISQEELGELIGVHENTIRTWEKGVRSPDAKKLNLLAEALKTTVAYLLGESDTPDKLTTSSEGSSEALFIKDSEYNDKTKIQDSVPSMAYWGSLVDNAEKAAEEGKNLDVITYLVNKALVILQTAWKPQKTTSHSRALVLSGR